jgi:uncharacterized phage protein gp47/JayE
MPIAVIIPAPTIDATGCHIPSYSTYYNYFLQSALSLYGSDVDFGPDTQDGQLLGIYAQATYDAALGVLGAYNAMSPQTAQGVGLSSAVKINGIARDLPENSSVFLTLTGAVGYPITNGIAEDALGNEWALPASVVFPSGGNTLVTATSIEPGPVAAAPNSINVIGTPTAGWYSVNNPAAASPGVLVEQDGALRIRQGQSVALPSQALVIGLLGALQALPGVGQAWIDENNTSSTNANGTPAKSIWCVVSGGTASQITGQIAIDKSMGCGTRGSITQTITNPGQSPVVIGFDAPVVTRMIYAITIKALPNYNSNIGLEIVAALQAYVSSVAISGLVGWQASLIAASLLTESSSGTATVNPDAFTYRITSLQLAIYGNALATADVQLSPGYDANAASGDITLTVT